MEYLLYIKRKYKGHEVVEDDEEARETVFKTCRVSIKGLGISLNLFYIDRLLAESLVVAKLVKKRLRRVKKILLSSETQRKVIA